MISNFLGSLNSIQKITLFLLAFAFTLSASAQSAADGEKLFKANCTSCHAVHEQVTGPALKDVQTRRDEAWLLKWIKNAPAVVKSGDSYAVALYEKFNKTEMTAFTSFSDNDVKSILAYIKEESAKGPAVSKAADNTASTGTGVASAAPDKSLKSRINWLLFIIIALLAVVIVMIFGILDKVGRIQGREVINWSKVNGTLLFIFGIVGMSLAIWEFMEHGKLTVNWSESASEHGVGIDKMFNITLLFTGIVFVLTQVALFFFAWKYNGKPGKKAFFYAHNDRVEYIWTIIPAIVLTILVINGLKYWNRIFTKPAEGTAQIEIYAYQFGWTARYPGADKQLGKHDFRQIGKVNALGVLPEDPKSADDFVSNEIHLPVNKPVTFKFRSKDVIHSAYLPHFRTQMNVVPGLPTEFTFTPTITTADMRNKMGQPQFDYALLCNKICGAAHYRMKTTVVIDTQEDYDKWVAAQKPAFGKPAEEAAPAVTPADTASAPAEKVTLKHSSKQPLASAR